MPDPEVSFTHRRRTPALAAACLTMILGSSGNKQPTTTMMRHHALSYILVSQTPRCEGGADQMILGSQQTSAHAHSRTAQGTPFTSSQQAW